jgi:hypothetical protein
MVSLNWFQFLKEKKRRYKLDSPTPIFIPNLNLGFQNLLLTMNLPSLGSRIEKLKEDGDGDDFAPLSPPSQPPKCFLHKPLVPPFFFFIAAVVFVPMCLLFLCAHNYGDDEHDVKGNGPITLPLLLPLKDLSTKLQA